MYSLWCKGSGNHGSDQDSSRGEDKLMVSKRKPDRFDRLVQRIRMKHGIYDSSNPIRAFHNEIVRALRRVDRAAYKRGHTAGWVGKEPKL